MWLVATMLNSEALESSAKQKVLCVLRELWITGNGDNGFFNVQFTHGVDDASGGLLLVDGDSTVTEH